LLGGALGHTAPPLIRWMGRGGARRRGTNVPPGNWSAAGCGCARGARSRLERQVYNLITTLSRKIVFENIPTPGRNAEQRAAHENHRCPAEIRRLATSPNLRFAFIPALDALLPLLERTVLRRHRLTNTFLDTVDRPKWHPFERCQSRYRRPIIESLSDEFGCPGRYGSCSRSIGPRAKSGEIRRRLLSFPRKAKPTSISRGAPLRSMNHPIGRHYPTRGGYEHEEVDNRLDALCSNGGRACSRVRKEAG